MMRKDVDVRPLDRRLRMLVTLPGWLGFLILALGAAPNKWLHWLLLLGGIYVSLVIWHRLYDHFVRNAAKPHRALFYIACLSAQCLLGLSVLFVIKGSFV